jgi:glycosyltransferase involved in cell wall biosynthesis
MAFQTMALKNVKKIIWIASTLNEVGGGTRLLLEGAKYYRSLGIDVQILTWDFKPEALFNNRYSAEGIEVIEGSQNTGQGLVARAIRRLATVLTLRRKIIDFNPDIIFNQSEYDATLLKLALAGTKFNFASFVFGQMYQFHEDLQKYAFPYRKHLLEIRNSTPGYKQLVPLKRPPSRYRDIVLAQIIAIPRYFALRSSIAIMVFSKQVQWEVSKVYGAHADIRKGAYPISILAGVPEYVGKKLRQYPNERILLSLSRLIQKKRVDLKIEALAILVHQRKRKDVRLVIGGKGGDKDKLLKLVSELKLEKYVTYLGYVQEEDVFPLTASCDLYLSLDVADFDISPFEALAMKRKIVWSSEMDLDDYLASCGAIFPVEPNPSDLADAIEKALAKDVSTLNWEGRDRYSWENYFQSILELVESRLKLNAK